ncbi:MAG: HisA/HisF-related TIM barrel protein, partial [Balneolaceae bacterium]
MQVIPAIDLYNGKCVRLHKGNYNEVTVYHDSPVEQAQEFQ